jgi:hypothetical protein
VSVYIYIWLEKFDLISVSVCLSDCVFSFLSTPPSSPLSLDWRRQDTLFLYSSALALDFVCVCMENDNFAIESLFHSHVENKNPKHGVAVPRLSASQGLESTCGMQNHEEGSGGGASGEGDHESRRPNSASPQFELDATNVFAFKASERSTPLSAALGGQEDADSSPEREGVSFLPSGGAIAVELAHAPVPRKAAATEAILASPPRMRPSPIGIPPEAERDLSADDPFLAGVVESLNVEGDASPLFRPKKVATEEMLNSGSTFDNSGGGGGGGTSIDTSPSSSDMDRPYESNYLGGYNRSFSHNNDSASPFLEVMHSDRPSSAASLESSGLRELNRPGSLGSWPLHPNIVTELEGNQNSLFDQIGPKGGHPSPSKTKVKHHEAVKSSGNDDMSLNIEFGSLNSSLGGMDLQRSNSNSSRPQNQSDGFGGYSQKHGEPFHAPREQIPPPRNYPQTQGDLDSGPPALSFDGEPDHHLNQTTRNVYAKPSPPPVPSHSRDAASARGETPSDARYAGQPHPRQQPRSGHESHVPSHIEHHAATTLEQHGAHDPHAFSGWHMLHSNELMAAATAQNAVHASPPYNVIRHHPSQQQQQQHSAHASYHHHHQAGTAHNNLPFHAPPPPPPYMNASTPMAMDHHYDPRYGYAVHDMHGMPPQPQFAYGGGDMTENGIIPLHQFSYGEMMTEQPHGPFDPHQQQQAQGGGGGSERRTQQPPTTTSSSPSSRVVFSASSSAAASSSSAGNLAMMPPPMQSAHPGLAPGMQTSHMTLGPDGINYHRIYMAHPGMAAPMPSAGTAAQLAMQSMQSAFASDPGSRAMMNRRGVSSYGGASHGNPGGVVNNHHPRHSHAPHDRGSSSAPSMKTNVGRHGQNQRSRGLHAAQQQQAPQHVHPPPHAANSRGMPQQSQQVYMQPLAGNGQPDARNAHLQYQNHAQHHNQKYPQYPVHNLPPPPSQAHANFHHPQMVVHGLGPGSNNFQGLNSQMAPNNIRPSKYHTVLVPCM